MELPTEMARDAMQAPELSGHLSSAGKVLEREAQEWFGAVRKVNLGVVFRTHTH